MKKVLVLMVALCALAVPSAAFATSDGNSDNGNGENGGQFRDNTQSQSASAGPCSNISQQQAIGGRTGNGNGEDNGNGGDSVSTFSRNGNGNGRFGRSGGISQSSSQSTNCVSGGVVVRRVPVIHRVVTGVSGTGVVNSGVSSVRNLGLARTGFDAWILVVIGGAALAGGLGLLAVQRRRRLG
jgi:LPXTG-motif cell wall-anchored protein